MEARMDYDVRTLPPRSTWQQSGLSGWTYKTPTSRAGTTRGAASPHWSPSLTPVEPVRGAGASTLRIPVDQNGGAATEVPRSQKEHAALKLPTR